MNKFFTDEEIHDLKIQDSVSKIFVPKAKGWKITHTYRAKNGFGALGIHGSIFTLNFACDSIIDIQDVKD